MSFVFFEDVLMALGHRLNFEAISNFAGNSFAKDSWKMIQENNPFNLKENALNKEDQGIAGLVGLINRSGIKAMGKKENRNGKNHH